MLHFFALLGCSGSAPGTEPPGEVDADLDGFGADEDCDDDDRSVFPGAYEVCDAIDQDCDGAIDDAPALATSGYADDDGDGYGTGDAPACGGTANTNDDCGPDDVSVYPGAPEVCDDGVDQDCDGADLRCGPWGTVALEDVSDRIVGDGDAYWLGSALSEAGDTNGDGYADLWVAGSASHGIVLLFRGPITGEHLEDEPR